MTEQTCQCSIDDEGTATITLNRPEVHNALDLVLVESLSNTLRGVDTDPGVRSVFLTSAGKHFCAGMDLLWLQKSAGLSTSDYYPEALKLAELMYTLYSLSKPTVALVQGAAYGGGAGLVSCCDIVLASEQARFCFSELRLGLIPAIISPYVIRAIGERTARRFFLTAEVFGAEEAARIGLVHQIISSNSDLKSSAKRLADALKSGGPHALSATKKLLEEVSIMPLDESTRQKTAQWLTEVRLSEEANEGISAFMEKRRPSWVEDK